MSEFDPPRTRRAKRRVEAVRTVLGSFEHERQVRVNMNAVEAVEGHSDRWYEARERLYDHQARYGHVALEKTMLGQQEYELHVGVEDEQPRD